MRLLVSGNTRQVRELALRFPDHLGHLLTPRNTNRGAVVRGLLPFGADNGAFHGLEPERFRRLLNVVRTHLQRCLWVVCPDVVADALATIRQFGQWYEEMRSVGVPLAFVGQDGAENLDLPWDAFDAWFIGGSTAWKLSRASADLAAEAKRRGKWVHMGRVNSMRRLRIALRFGCDSCDGSSYSRFHHRTITERPDMSLERHLRFLCALQRQDAAQLPLFGDPTC